VPIITAKTGDKLMNILGGGLSPRIALIIKGRQNKITKNARFRLLAIRDFVLKTRHVASKNKTIITLRLDKKPDITVEKV
jgi:hypothetical protein